MALARTRIMVYEYMKSLLVETPSRRCPSSKSSNRDRDRNPYPNASRDKAKQHRRRHRQLLQVFSTNHYVSGSERVWVSSFLFEHAIVIWKVSASLGRSLALELILDQK
jgi:hypothetical protein